MSSKLWFSFLLMLVFRLLIAFLLNRKARGVISERGVKRKGCNACPSKLGAFSSGCLKFGFGSFVNESRSSWYENKEVTTRRSQIVIMGFLWTQANSIFYFIAYLPYEYAWCGWYIRKHIITITFNIIVVFLSLR